MWRCGSESSSTSTRSRSCRRCRRSGVSRSSIAAAAAGTLQRVFCGSAPLSAPLWKRVQEWTGTRDVCNAYGITETGSWVAGTTVGDFEPEDGLIGVPWGSVIRIMKSSRRDAATGPGRRMRHRRVGIRLAEHPGADEGIPRPRRSHRTGRERRLVHDRRYRHARHRGWLYLRGRERDEINRGGMKIYPSDIDAVVERFAGATDVCALRSTIRSTARTSASRSCSTNRVTSNLRALHAWLRQHLATPIAVALVRARRDLRARRAARSTAPASPLRVSS